jgi:hypothetical protein
MKRDEFDLAVEAVELGVPADFVTTMLSEGITANYYIDWDEYDYDPPTSAGPPGQKFEVAPYGMSRMVKAMKKTQAEGDAHFDNPFALAWWMKNQGYKSRKD